MRRPLSSPRAAAWRVALALAWLFALALPAAAQPWSASATPETPATLVTPQPLPVLAFHDIRQDVRASFATDPDESAVDVSVLAALFGWLRAHDWQPVRLEQVLRARGGGPPLPPRALLLTFDDGYASAYDKVFPLLQAFGFPAVMPLATAWLEVPEGGSVPFGELPLPRSRFLRWEQARAMAASGLVEFASHTHDLHRGIVGNPQGNLMPAAATRGWQDGRYETEPAWRARVQEDLRRSVELLQARVGQRPRAIAWPYGAWNAELQALAAGAGLEVGFDLADEVNPAGAPLAALSRLYVTYDMDLGAIVSLLEPPPGPGTGAVHRAVHVDLDAVHDPDPAQQERNLSQLLERIAAIGPRAVYLQAFADPDGDGVADALYFPNRHLPLRADLFGRVAWQLRTRARVQVYAWMPVLAFRLPPGHPARERRVLAADAAPAGATPRYERLSPFDPLARAAIGEIYDDLGRHAQFAGVLFHDDATLAQDEDASPAALQAYAEAGLPATLAQLRADPPATARWAAFKARALTEFTQQLAERLRRWQPRLRTARNLYAASLAEPASVQWLAQDFAAALPAYDHTVLMAMPRMEGQPRPLEWLEQLARLAAALPLGRERAVFELQARDWRDGRAVPDVELEQQALRVQRHGIRHLAYYPDDFLAGRPGLEAARRVFSVRDAYAGAPRLEALPEAARLPGARGRRAVR